MKTREVSVIGRTVYGNGEVELIRTSVGIDQMHVLFDSAEWVAFGAVSVTFKNSADTENPITTSVTPTAIDSPDWSAEATCLIPWEVIQNVGDIAVTFQATDSSSNHIITARAESVLSVIEAGDVEEGTVPETAPTISEWEQAYADTMAAASSAADAAAQVEAILDSSSATTLEELLEELGMSMRYKGSVDTFAELPNDADFGETYNVVETYGYYPPNTDWTWTGTAWNALGGELAIDEITPEDVANIVENPGAYIDGDLPDGAKRLEYIVSDLDSQTQVAPSIDTGIACNAQNLRVEVKYENGAIVNGFLFGDSSIPENATFAARYLAASNGIEFESGGVVWSTEDVGVMEGVHTVALISSGSGYVDGVEYEASETIGTNPSTTIKLCGTSEAYMSGARALRGKLYYARIWVDGTLALDLVPAIANDVACMYDRVSGDFFASTTSRAFTAGPELNSHLLLSQSGFAAAWIEAKNEFANKSTATESTNGLMSSADKSKLDTMPESLAGTGLVVEDGTLSLGDIVTDSCDGPIYSVDAEGWSDQRTTTGKNLLNLLDAPIEKTSELTYTVNDGTIVLIANTDAGYSFVAFKAVVSASATYTLSFGVNNSNNYVTVENYNSSGTRISSLSTTETSKTFTTPENTTYCVIAFFARRTNGGNADDSCTYSDVLFEAGSTATEWEPYSGAKPSPSPEFPQTIEVCRGRNLLDESASEVNYYIDSNGIRQGGTGWAVSDYIPVTHGETYTFNVDTSASSSAKGVFYDSSKTVIANSVFNSGPITITVPSSAAFVRLSYKTSSTTPQLELGSTPTPYVPYGHVGLEVQGRNILGDIEFANAFERASGVSVDHESKTIYYNASSIQYKVIFTDFEESTQYTFVLYGKNGNDSSGATNLMVVYSDDTSDTLSFSAVGTNSYCVFTTAAGKTVSRLQGYWATTSTTLYYDKCGVFKGEISLSEFEPYYHETRAIPLPLKSDGERWAGGLPDGTADELSIDSAGKWEWTNGLWEYVITGNETHVGDEDLGTYYRTALSNALSEHPSITSHSNMEGFCSHAPVGNHSWTDDSLHAYTHDNLIAIFGECSTAADLIAMYTGAVFLYPLATPTTEHGYVDLPMDIPEGSTITIPELENTNVRCFVHGAAELAVHAANWGERAKEQESRIAALEAAVAELATS